MSATIEDLTQEVRGMRALLEAVAAVLQPAGSSRPLSAEELMVRWSVPGETLELRLDNLAKRCRARGLRPMSGTRGMSATYMVADVVAAEGFSNGTTKRRRRL
jgi:hypothetical protein